MVVPSPPPPLLPEADPSTDQQSHVDPESHVEPDRRWQQRERRRFDTDPDGDPDSNPDRHSIARHNPGADAGIQAGDHRWIGRRPLIRRRLKRRRLRRNHG